MLQRVTAAFSYTKCRGRINEDGERLSQTLLVSLIGDELRVYSEARAEFYLTIDLAKITGKADTRDPYGCDSAFGVFFVPPEAITASLPTSFEGFLDLESNTLHVDAVNQEDFSWFWLEVFAPY
jgi:hypothetical protein